jgi:hypothetical protein
MAAVEAAAVLCPGCPDECTPDGKLTLLVILLIIFYKRHVSFQILMLGTCECCVTQSVPRAKRSANAVCFQWTAL